MITSWQRVSTGTTILSALVAALACSAATAQAAPGHKNVPASRTSDFRLNRPDSDVALRARLELGARQWSEAFLTLRYLGGGFRGEGSEDTPLVGSDRWSSNSLHTLTFSLGIGLR